MNNTVGDSYSSPVASVVAGLGILPRDCTVCGNPIPEKRIVANPKATECVPCLENLGDVPPLKRFDETVGEEVYSTMFQKNVYIDKSIYHQNNFVPSDEAFEQAVGDDSFLERERGAGIGADSLASAFEEDHLIYYIEKHLRNLKQDNRIHGLVAVTAA
jgi:hypothetical protein